MILIPATTIYLALVGLWLCLAAGAALGARILDRDPLAWLGLGLVFGIFAVMALALLGRPGTVRYRDDVSGPEYDAVVASQQADSEDRRARRWGALAGAFRPLE